MKHLSLLSFLALATVVAACKDDLPVVPSNKGSIVGRVTDFYSGLALSGVTVQTQPSLQSVNTDNNGYFKISDVPVGTYSVVAQKTGYNTRSVQAVVTSDLTTTANLILDSIPAVGNGGATRLDANFISLPGGTYSMGSSNGYDEEKPIHTVTVNAFIIADHEVTQAEWLTLMPSNPSQFVNANNPVENVSWYDAVAYCNALSVQNGLQPSYVINGQSVTWNSSANGYRLPTEAEWEYACRAGTSTDFYNGNLAQSASTCYDDSRLNAIGWYCSNSSSPQNVKQKLANPYGLYDITGNVFEWCWDWNGAYPSSPQINPQGSATGTIKICRGGSFFYIPRQSRSAFRLAYSPTSKYSGVGFRVVRNAQ